MTDEEDNNFIEPEYNINRPNRQKKLAPKTSKFWCGGCDGYLVGHGERCKRCGFRNIKNRHIRLKKD